MRLRYGVFSILTILMIFSLAGCDTIFNGGFNPDDYFQVYENNMDNPTFAFACNLNRSGWETSICLADENSGGGYIELISSKKGQTFYYPDTPSWSPDRKKLAFKCDIEENPHICVIDIKGKEKLIVPTLGLNAQWTKLPNWSPDGSKLLFHFLAIGPDDEYIDSIGVVTLDGDLKIWQYEVDDPYFYRGYKSHPQWSPDGKQVSFVCDAHNLSGICIFDVDSEDAPQNWSVGASNDTTSNNTTWIGDQRWSPDGEKIVYTCNTDICVMYLDPNRPRRVRNISDAVGSTGPDGRPRWSLDGEHIIYECEHWETQSRFDVEKWCVANFSTLDRRINVTETFKKNGYPHTMISFEGLDPIVYSCKGYDEVTCHSLGEQLGNLFDLLSSFNDFQDFDI